MNIIKGLMSNASIHGPGGFKIEGPVIFVIPAIIAVLFFIFASLVWVYRDAGKRDRNGFVALIFILLTGWPGSFLWWFWLRPPLKRAVS
jgi:hypothetical protein